MVMKYLYDTNTFIYHFADETLIAEWFREDFLNKNQVIISTIVKMELLCYPRLSAEEEKSIREFLKQFDTIFILTLHEITDPNGGATFPTLVENNTPANVGPAPLANDPPNMEKPFMAAL